MIRVRTTTVLAALCAVGVLLGVVLHQRAQRNDDVTSSKAPPVSARTQASPAAHGHARTELHRPSTVVRWESSWPRARAAAKRRGQLICLYVGTDPARCPPCRELEAGCFSDPDVAALNTDCVPLHITIDDPGPSPEHTLLQRLRPGATPMLLILTPAGAVVHRQHAHLYNSYRTDLAPYGAPTRTKLRGADLVALMRRLGKATSAAQARMVALAKAGTATALREMGEQQLSWEQYAAATISLRRALELEDSPETLSLLAAAQELAGRAEQARISYGRLLNQRPAAPDALEWEFALTRLDRETGIDQSVERLRALAERAHGSRAWELEAFARGDLVEIHAEAARTEDVDAGLEWFARNYLGDATEYGPLDPALRLRIARHASARGQHPDALAHIERLSAEHPLSAEAQTLKHGLLHAWREAAGRSHIPATQETPQD